MKCKEWRMCLFFIAGSNGCAYQYRSNVSGISKTDEKQTDRERERIDVFTLVTS